MQLGFWFCCVHIVVYIYEYTTSMQEKLPRLWLLKHNLFYSVVLSSPSILSVEEGAADRLLFCLEVTEHPGVIYRKYLVESLPTGSAKSKTTNIYLCERLSRCNTML